MIKVDKIEVFNFEGAFRGLRNPLESHAKSDSIGDIGDLDYESEALEEVLSSHILALAPDAEHEDALTDTKRDWLALNCDLNDDKSGHFSNYFMLGPNDLALAQRMIAAGTDESKFLRQIFFSMDIEAPLYW